MALIRRTERRIIKVKGRPVEIVREQYLRSDIGCRSSLCNNCTSEEHHIKLPKDVTHYLIPFKDVALQYLEVLEFPEMRGMIFPQTLLLKAVSDGGKSVANKFNKILQDPRKESITFLNENCVHTYAEREDNESLDKWRARNIYNVGVWYSLHLDRKMPIVLVTENEEIISMYEDATADVYVISLGKYLKEFWPDLTISHDIYDSLTALLNMGPISEIVSGFSDYLQMERLEFGLKNGIYHEGKLKVNKHQAQDEAFVVSSSSDTEKETQRDILIIGSKDRNRAVHGDLVYVEILPKAFWKGRCKALGNHENGKAQVNGTNSEVMPTGRIVGIKQRNWRDYVACLPQVEKVSKTQSQDRVLVIPFDYRIPKIRIVTRQAALLENVRIVVRIDSWDINSQYPNGHFVKIIGKIGDVTTESMTLMVENSINIQPFSSRVNEEMPVITGQPEFDVGNRKDLRTSHLICSIDPKGCEDVDDALSVRQLPNGLTELGIHIADVTHYVLPNSFTDMEARDRATTVYLAEKRYDMLPAVLSSNLCSLLGNVDRYAVSLLCTLDDKCQIIGTWFGRTVVRSSYKLFYELAQEVIDSEAVKEFSEFCENEQISNDEADINERFCKLRESLIKLTSVAQILKTNRLYEGALELDGNEIQFEFGKKDKTHILSVKTKQSLAIHETVAECMIFANRMVAQKIYDAFPTHALLRNHPEPKQESFEYLRLLAQYKGFHLNTKSNKLLSTSLDYCVDPNDPLVNKIMRSLVVHSMNQASYFSTGSLSPDQYFHYGLALNLYTHFTSPIRRYADILVHRLLLAIADNKFEEAGVVGNKALQDICGHINERHIASKHVQQQSQSLFQAFYFASLPPNDPRHVTDAVVYAIRLNGVLVYLPMYGIKGPVYLINKEQQVAFFQCNQLEWTSGKINSDKYAITITSADDSTQSYHLFDHITVCVVVSNPYAHAPVISLDLISNKPHPDWQHVFHELSCSKTLLQKTPTKTENIPDVINEQINPIAKIKTSTKELLYTVIEVLRDYGLQS